MLLLLRCCTINDVLATMRCSLSSEALISCVRVTLYFHDIQKLSKYFSLWHHLTLLPSVLPVTTTFCRPFLPMMWPRKASCLLDTGYTQSLWQCSTFMHFMQWISEYNLINRQKQKNHHFQIWHHNIPNVMFTFSSGTLA